MTLTRMLIRETLHRWPAFLLAVAAVAVATAAWTAMPILLRLHDQVTRGILSAREAETRQRVAVFADEMRKATLKLSFNLVILPANQDVREWHANDFATETMPEEYADRLAHARTLSVRHILPVLQQKVLWPEVKRTIILVGTRGEIPDMEKSPLRPLQQPVADGCIALGHELHRSLRLQAGEKVTLLGREFTISKCNDGRGNKDDITAWIPLKDAQALLDRPGRVNAILALECLCADSDLLPIVRAEVGRILPGTQVLESGSRALARLEARVKADQEATAALAAETAQREAVRTELERFVAVLTPGVIAAALLWLTYLAWANVRERTPELAVLGAVGLRPRHILALFLGRALTIGLAGGGFGLVLGSLSGRLLAPFVVPDAGTGLAGMGIAPDTRIALTALLGAVAVSVVAGWVPALLAAQRDPAAIIQKT